MLRNMDGLFGGGFGGGFGRMFEEMNQMTAEMDRAMAGMHLAGGPGGMTAGQSYSMSSRTMRGADGHTVQYSSSTRSSNINGGETVSETHRNYKDSTGLEKAGVSRSVGDRARMLVRERLANGEERSRDDVHNCQDPDSFDQEWQRAATHAQLHRLRGLEGLGGGFGGLPRPAPPVQLTAEDRRAARRGRDNYAQQHQRILEEARRERANIDEAPRRALSYTNHDASSYTPNRYVPTNHARGDRAPSYSQRSPADGLANTQLPRARREDSSFSRMQGGAASAARLMGNPAATGTSLGGGGGNTRLARQFAQEENSRLWRER